MKEIFVLEKNGDPNLGRSNNPRRVAAYLSEARAKCYAGPDEKVVKYIAVEE